MLDRRMLLTGANVVVVVLDIQNSCHEEISGTFLDKRDLATTWRTRSMRVVGLNVSFRRTISIPEFSRA